VSTDARAIVLLMLCSILLVVTNGVQAHDARPVYIEITEQTESVFQLQWKVPVAVPLFAQPTVVMPEPCDPLGEPIISQQAGAYFHQQGFSCPGGLSGHRMTLRFPSSNPSLSSLVQVNLLNGEHHTQVLSPGADSWEIPESENFWNVAGQYTLLGIKHILLGVDHLLFVACLVFIAGNMRRILITITGFTLAHSITLVLSTLQIVRLPSAPVEAAIALSIAFLAHEIVVGKREQSWTWRYPVTVSASFGLLHGCGFAAALLEVGLPQTELPAALLFFNIGVEIGQIVFVLTLAATALFLARIFETAPGHLLEHRRVNLAGSYLIGCLASFWLLERIGGF